MILTRTVFERILHRFHLLPTPLLDSFGSVLYGRALAIAVRRGVFEALETKPLTVPEIARNTSMSHEGVELLVESFVVGGYLARNGNRYSLSAEGAKWLVKSSAAYLGNLVRYFETLYDRWSYLEHSLDHGQPPQRYYERFSDEDWKVYVLAMRDLARLLMAHVQKRIALPPNPKSLLDLGGSHGLYAMECCRRYPTLKAQVIDFDEALRHAAAIVRQGGMEGRVTLTPGDFLKMDLPAHQDGVLAFNIIHGLSEEENRSLVARVMNALVPGGKLYILDQIKGEAGKSQFSRFMPLMVGLNLLNEIGGNTYTFSQVKSWCGAADVRQYRLHLPGVSLIEVVR